MRKPVIICVDDESIVLESLRIELRQFLGNDCLIETAEGGQEALELLEELKKDNCEIALVLADYIMPGIKGDELLKQIHERSPQTLNIMLSGQADLEAVGNAIRHAKLYRYISKPWESQDLCLTVVEAVQSYLKDRKLEVQRQKLQQNNKQLAQLVKKVEQARATQQRSEEQLKDIVNNAVASITSFRVFAENVWEYEYRSAGCERVFGYTAEEMLADKGLWRSRVHPEDRETIVSPTYQKVFAGISPITVEYRFYDKQDKIRWVSSTLSARRDTEADCWVVTSVETDIGDRKAAEQARNELYEQVQALNTNLEHQVEERTAELRQKMAELEELSQLKDNFLHAVSHDLRTPLMGMLLVLKELLNHADGQVTMSRSIVNRMIQSGERQLDLLNSLLDAHFNEIQGMTLHQEPIHLPDFIRTIVQDVEPLLTKNQATLTNAFPQQMPLIQADPPQLRRVFENLITNALKHNPQGIHITLRAEVEPTQIRCSVQDDGMGIDEPDSKFLFERYTRSNHRSPGIGLGLYLCRQIISAHGGEIGVTSTVNEGAVFWFTLPILGE